MAHSKNCTLKNKKSICLGITPWKRANFLHFVGGSCMARFEALSKYEDAVDMAARTDSRIICWASAVPDGLKDYCNRKRVPLVLVEDGFIRSAGLGIKLNLPASLCFSFDGIHYDSTSSSELETYLETGELTKQEREDGEDLVAILRDMRISKYNIGGTSASWPGDSSSRRILVIGQVEDDASVRLGSPEVKRNLELLKRARARNPEASIVYRPHPDVTSGLRAGTVKVSDALNECDKVSETEDLWELIETADEVHVISSQTGFEALLLGKQVVCHGQPFYAGWGLTTDLIPPERRTAHLSLAELCYKALIGYPSYIDPDTGAPATVFDTIERIQSKKTWPSAPRSYVLGVWLKRKVRQFKTWKARAPA